MGVSRGEVTSVEAHLSWALCEWPHVPVGLAESQLLLVSQGPILLTPTFTVKTDIDDTLYGPPSFEDQVKLDQESLGKNTMRTKEHGQREDLSMLRKNMSSLQLWEQEGASLEINAEKAS